MKIALTGLISLFLFIGCEKKADIPASAVITSKHIAFDEGTSQKILKHWKKLEIKDVKPFDTNESIKNPFQLGGKVYFGEFTFILNPDGTLKKAICHTVDNALKYAEFGIPETELNAITIADGFLVKFSPSREQIIDGMDTLEIAKVFTKEKLIFVLQDENNDKRRSIYEYK